MAATADDTDDGADLASLVLALIGSRQSVMPKRLLAPGPDDAQLHQMVDAAACAPDHRGLRPWRLVRIADQMNQPRKGVSPLSHCRLPVANDARQHRQLAVDDASRRPGAGARIHRAIHVVPVQSPLHVGKTG